MNTFSSPAVSGQPGGFDEQRRLRVGLCDRGVLVRENGTVVWRRRRAKADPQNAEFPALEATAESTGTDLLELSLGLICGRLNELDPGWRRRGSGLAGPDHLGVHVGAHRSSGDSAHVDVVFMLDRRDERAGVIRDCAIGVGDNPREQAETAVDHWFSTTAPVIYELFNQHGAFADHYRGDDPDGLTGWHVIHGPFQGWGVDDHPERLQTWAVEHPVLPQLARQLRAVLGDLELVSIRLLFGGDGLNDIAEVQINGTVDQDASEALLNLAWERPTDIGYVKAFVLAIHREDAGHVH